MEIAKIFVTGVVAIGLATALFMKGRTTVAAAGTVGDKAIGLLQTAETGKTTK